MSKKNKKLYFWKLIKEFQELKNPKIEQHILAEYYDLACKYAIKHINSTSYSNLLSYDVDEIKSYVYIAFAKALKTYKCDIEKSMSFKNYFYQLIKYETLQEIKKNFSWQKIPNYKIHCKAAVNEIKNDQTKDKLLKKIDVDVKVEKIYQFLLTKQELYAEIWKLKSAGFDNRDICVKLDLTAQEVKSKFQYIKRLILEKYSDINAIV